VFITYIEIGLTNINQLHQSCSFATSKKTVSLQSYLHTVWSWAIFSTSLFQSTLWSYILVNCVKTVYKQTYRNYFLDCRKLETNKNRITLVLELAYFFVLLELIYTLLSP